ncbi:MAG: TerB family tellurite resistance protein [Cyclobacteriaceae bacterium]|nr:TerB family tellurite resistance protein [Cyclobacteriaceae bacterium]
MTNNPHLSILVQMAQIDGETDETELELIRQIGKSENLSDDDIDKVIDTTNHEGGVPSIENLSDKDKLELMTNLILVMKIDGIVHKNEMQFCLDMIDKMGYNKEAFYELVSSTTNDIMSDNDIQVIRDKAKTLLG